MSETAISPFERDFSYDYYWRLVEALKVGRTLVTFSAILDTPAPEHPIGLLRHDVDFDPARAAALARSEQEHGGVVATYFFRPHSPFYRIHGEADRHIRDIVECGHEIGLHYDLASDYPYDQTALVADITAAARLLETESGVTVSSFSVHRPRRLGFALGGATTTAGLVNAYCQDLTQEPGASYMSDSGGRWRYGNPVSRLETCQAPIVQILTHPIWWNEQTVSTHSVVGQLVQRFEAISPSAVSELLSLDLGSLDDIVNHK